MRAGKNGDWPVRAALALLVLVFFREALAGGVFFERDIHLIWVPQIEGFVHAVAGGALPLWDPSPAFGQPLLADPQAQVLYPPTWLNLVLRPWVYYTLYAIGAPAAVDHAASSRWPVAGGCRGSPRRQRRARLGAVGPASSRSSNSAHHFAGASYMPAVFLAAEWAFETRRARRHGAARPGARAADARRLGRHVRDDAAGARASGVVIVRLDWRDWRVVRGAARRAGRRPCCSRAPIGAGTWVAALDAVSRSSRRDPARARCGRTGPCIRPASPRPCWPGSPERLPLAPRWREAALRRPRAVSGLALPGPAVPRARRRGVLGSAEDRRRLGARGARPRRAARGARATRAVLRPRGHARPSPARPALPGEGDDRRGLRLGRPRRLRRRGAGEREPAPAGDGARRPALASVLLRARAARRCAAQRRRWPRRAGATLGRSPCWMQTSLLLPAGIRPLLPARRGLAIHAAARRARRAAHAAAPIRAAGVARRRRSPRSSRSSTWPSHTRARIPSRRRPSTGIGRRSLGRDRRSAGCARLLVRLLGSRAAEGRAGSRARAASSCGGLPAGRRDAALALAQQTSLAPQTRRALGPAAGLRRRLQGPAARAARLPDPPRAPARAEPGRSRASAARLLPSPT